MLKFVLIYAIFVHVLLRNSPEPQPTHDQTRTGTSWGCTWLELPDTNGFHCHVYIYIYCIYILHLGAFNIENAPRPNLRARSTWSEPTAPPRPNQRFVFVPPARSRQNLFTSDSSLQLEDTPSCNQQATNVATGVTTHHAMVIKE
jgi:hypothetical protein